MVEKGIPGIMTKIDGIPIISFLPESTKEWGTVKVRQGGLQQGRMVI
jgi:hypothetical protein